MSVPITGWYNMGVTSENPTSSTTSPPAAGASTAKPIVPRTSNVRSSSEGNEEPSAHEEAASSTPKRLACDGCRERKVRCDKQHPKCRRCARLGHECNYSGPSKQTVLKNDLSRVLMTLHGRLSQAEAQLALSSPMLHMQQFGIGWPEVSVPPSITSTTKPGTGLQFSPTDPLQTHDFSSMNLLDGLDNTGMGEDIIMESNSEWLNNHNPDDANFNFGSIESTIPTEFSHAPPDTSHIFDINQRSHESSISSHSDASSQAAFKISAGIVSQLHATFFDVFHPIMPIINASRFQSELAQATHTIPLQALSHAIEALGALAMPEFSFAHEMCYNQARDLLDMCERQENGTNLADIDTLQACVFLTLYEFKRTNFARAWMTLGRAIRLGKMMSLVRHDEATASTGLLVPLPPTSNPAELEERRRTFWILYVFDAFAGIRTNSLSDIDDLHATVPLPCPESLTDIVEPTNMPSLQHITDLSGNVNLSSFAGTIVMISLHRRCVDHIRSSVSHETSYPFWVTHYRIDKSIQECKQGLLSQRLLLGPGSDDPLSLTLRMNLGAVEICLHETALAKVEQEHLPTSLLTEAFTSCQRASNDILEAVQSGQQLTDTAGEAFRQSSPFFIWPLTTAIQTCIRLLSYSQDDIPAHIKSLRMLSSSMKELVDLAHIPTTLSEEVDSKITEAERAEKRKKRVRKSDSSRSIPGVMSFNSFD